MQKQESTLPPTRIEYIDGLRGLAVAAVVLFHSAIWARLSQDGQVFKTLAIGRAGVDVFLVLSGFCLFYPLVKRGGPVLRLELRSYLWRRLRRIVPPYYVALTVVMATSWWAYQVLGNPSQALQHLYPATFSGLMTDTLTHLLMLHGLSNQTAHSFDGAFWSISLEWQFYLWFIPLAALARRSVAWAVALPVVITIAYRTAFAIASPDFLRTFVGNELSVGRLVAFGAGMGAAYALAKNSQMQRARRGMASFLFVVTFLIAVVYERKSEGIGVFLLVAWAALGCCLIMVAGTTTALKRTLESKPLQFLGRISYSVYLFHGSTMLVLTVSIMSLGFGGGGPVQQLSTMLIAPPLSIAVGYLFYRVVEKFFLPASLTRQAQGSRSLMPSA